MQTSDSYHDDAHPSALVAVFADRELARNAISQLHQEGFHKTWLGLTEPMRATDTQVQSDNALARFFGSSEESLHDALLKHGVSEVDARKLDDTLPARSAVVTVDGKNHPELAAQIVAQCEGEMVSSLGERDLYRSYGAGEADGKMSKDRLRDLGGYRAGEKLGEERRIQLREERLSVDKKREKIGEAVVSTHVTSHEESIDVPVMHEELYVERRPVAAGQSNVGEIGGDQTITVPLERERVMVTKNTVATEDVVVGQRRVEGVEHISETVRKEELDVDGDVGSDVERDPSRARR